MRPIDRLRMRLRSLFLRDRVERELAAELQFHVEELTRQKIERGLSPDQARAEALREFGANTAIFTLVETFILRELPVREPGALFQIVGVTPGQEGAQGSFSYPTFQFFRERAAVSCIATYLLRTSYRVFHRRRRFWHFCVSRNLRAIDTA